MQPETQTKQPQTQNQPIQQHPLPQPQPQPQQQIHSKKIYTEQSLHTNKQQMLKILKQSPICGLYKNQTKQNFEQFYKFYLNFLRSQIGPRGQCSKHVREQMSKDQQYYNKLLEILKVTYKTHIKDIYIRFKTYSPCNEYIELQKLQQNIQKTKQSYTKIIDNNSVMYQKIKEGMIEKYGENYDYVEEIKKIIEKYKSKLEMLLENKGRLQGILDQVQDYHRFVRIGKEMDGYFRMWKEADRRVGHDSVGKGQTFQKIVIESLLEYILSKSKNTNKIHTDLQQNFDKQKIKIQTNCHWHPKKLGEIDIAILLHNDITNKWQASILIECKSRLFDIRQAYNQVYIQKLKQKGKQKLCTQIGIVDLMQNVEYFIVTTLPENPFILPIQSHMKECLEKAAKNVPVDQLEKISEEVYGKVRDVFKDQLSPLEWFMDNDSDRIIVLNY